MDALKQFIRNKEEKITQQASIDKKGALKGVKPMISMTYAEVAILCDKIHEYFNKVREAEEKKSKKGKRYQIAPSSTIQIKKQARK